MRTRSILGVTGALVVVGLLLAAPLWAQQFPTSPIGKESSKDLVIPPGIYTTLIFACDGTKEGWSRATLRTPSGEMIVVVPVGQSVVVPVGNWTLGQQGTLKISDHPGVTLHVSALTPSGPVKFEPSK